MELTAEKLKKLKCCSCKNYLSVFPIMMNIFGDNICGRCYEILSANQEPGVFLRNSAYEELASSCIFPCRYQINGCPYQINGEMMSAHEHQCSFTNKLSQCPVIINNNQCRWSGKLQQLENHFKSDHEALIVNHPFQEKPNISRNNQEHFLMNCFGYLFLLQIATDIFSDEIVYDVLFLGESELLGLFTFKVLISNNENSLSKTGAVSTFSKERSDGIDTGIKIYISSLLKDFGGLQNFDVSVRLVFNKFCMYRYLLL